jgi:plasmid stability protein
MAVLHVRNIPDNLYAQAQMIASEQGTTLSALVIELMQQAATRHLDHKRHLKAIARMRRNLTLRQKSDVSAATLIQEVREEREIERSR